MEDPVQILLKLREHAVTEEQEEMLTSPPPSPVKGFRASLSFKRFPHKPQAFSKWNLREYHHLFISHCCMLSLFPLRYEFSRQELVMLWVAGGLFPDYKYIRPEDAGFKMFDLLVSRGVIVLSSPDPSADFFHHKTRKMLHRVNRSRISSFKYSSSALGYVKILNANTYHSFPDTVQHLSIDSKTIDHIGFESLKRFHSLETLFITPAPGFYLERVPRDVFLSLKQLRSLNFSRSLLSELPSSIGNLTSIRYIDLSYTRIKRLPDSIVGLHNLQTLKLRGCSELVGLPKRTGKLTSLRHLDLDIIGKLRSMPPGMGNLIHLQTLSAYLVGKDDGCRIVELKNMVNLTGAFCISRIEQVSSSEEAREADLSGKKFLSRLQLRWTETREDDSGKQEQILQWIQPPLGLEELTIVSYGGYKLPSWIADPSYEHLVDITLYGCMNCECLPPIGKLPSLQCLNIREMNEIRKIDEQFCRDGEGKQCPAFPSLKELSMDLMPALEEWIGVQNGNFPCLQKLKVRHCPKLVSVQVLSCLCSLKHLEFSYCPNISLPEGEIATSLEYLVIKDCSELLKTCNKVDGKDWGKIAHVPNIFMDDEEITCQ